MRVCLCLTNFNQTELHHTSQMLLKFIVKLYVFLNMWFVVSKWHSTCNSVMQAGCNVLNNLVNIVFDHNYLVYFSCGKQLFHLLMTLLGNLVIQLMSIKCLLMNFVILF